MKNLTQFFLSSLILLVLVVPFSATAGITAESTRQEQFSRAQSIVNQGERVSSRIAGLKTQGEREKDIIKVNCLNSKLAQVNANLRNAKGRLDALTIELDLESRRQAMTVMDVLGQKFQVLNREAAQCVGQNVFEPGIKDDTPIVACSPKCIVGETCKLVDNVSKCVSDIADPADVPVLAPPPPTSTCQDSEYKGSDGACKKVSTCPSGQYASKVATATSDTVCTAVTTCPPGQFEESAPTATSDRVCKAATACPPGQYASKAATATSDTVCSTVTACSASEYEVSAPTKTSDRVCKAVSNCEQTAGDVDACVVCSSGYYLSDGACVRENKRPVAKDDSEITISADSKSTVINVLDNDTDPDNDKLSVIKPLDKSGTKGLVILYNGVISYDPNGKFNDLEKGKTATDTFKYTISDGNDGAATATVTISVNGVKEKPAPVDCVVSGWSEFSECSESCGGGTQTRTRTISVEPENGGKACPELKESKACNTEACPTTPATSASSKKTTGANVVEKILAFSENEGQTFTEDSVKKIRFTVTLSCPDDHPAECSASECAKTLKDCPTSPPSGGSIVVNPTQVESGGSVSISAPGWLSVKGGAVKLGYSWSAKCEGSLGNYNIAIDTSANRVKWTAPLNISGSVKQCTLTVEVSDGDDETTASSTVLKVKPAPLESGS